LISSSRLDDFDKITHLVNGSLFADYNLDFVLLRIQADDFD